MDLNLVMLCGRVAATPEVRVVDSGTQMVRLLITVHAEKPRRRIDVVPVSVWDPPDDLIDPGVEVGDRVWVSGSVERRHWDGPMGRRSRIEVLAHHVTRTEACGSSTVPAD